MSWVYVGDEVLINCTDPAGQHNARGVVTSTNYGQNGSRYHVGVRPEAAPDEVHWHETACLEVIRPAPATPPESPDSSPTGTSDTKGET